MQRLIAKVTFVAGLVLMPGLALASGDYGCDRSWSILQPDYAKCSNVAMLSPGNDTRTNLTLLTSDLVEAGGNDRYGHVLFRWNRIAFENKPEPVDEGNLPEYSHSHCQTLESGEADFRAAVERAKLRRKERELLLDARSNLRQACDSDAGAGAEVGPALPTLEELKSKKARSFGSYLVAAFAFYAGDFGAATPAFAALHDASDPWLREAGRYMVGRSEVNRAIENAFGKYGWFDEEKVSDEAVTGALNGFLVYLRDYPKGQYSESARGLLRRVYWLQKNPVKLSEELAEQLDNPKYSGPGTIALNQEIDDKFLPLIEKEIVGDDPRLLAMLVLYRMRVQQPCEYCDPAYAPPVVTVEQIKALKPKFDGYSYLYEYLLAAHAYYVQDDPRAVIAMIEDDARRDSYDAIQFSRQMLRGMALHAVGDRNTPGFYRELLGGATKARQRGAVELALAQYWEQNAGLDRVFADDSPIKDAPIREQLLAFVAGPDLLKQQVKQGLTRRERDLAAYVLLYKALTRRQYRLFTENVGQLAKVTPNTSGSGPLWGPVHGSDEDYYDYAQDEPAIDLAQFAGTFETDFAACSGRTLPNVVEALDGRKSLLGPTKALLCVTEFLRTSGYDQYWLDDEQPGEKELAGSESRFPGKLLSRLEVYKGLINARKSDADVRSYALYRAVRCYAPTGTNSCGGIDVPESQRQAWFRELKGRYPNSSWAKQLKYYW